MAPLISNRHKATVRGWMEKDHRATHQKEHTSTALNTDTTNHAANQQQTNTKPPSLSHHNHQPRHGRLGVGAKPTRELQKHDDHATQRQAALAHELARHLTPPKRQRPASPTRSQKTHNATSGRPSATTAREHKRVAVDASSNRLGSAHASRESDDSDDEGRSSRFGARACGLSHPRAPS